MSNRHFLKVCDLSAQEIQSVLGLARELKSERQSGIMSTALAGKTLAMVFEKPSNRTRLSFEVAMFQLGGHAMNIHPSEIKMGEREPVSDVAKVMSRYADGIMLRVLRHETLEEFAASSSVPVINGLSNLHHPCQALADMLTIAEKKPDLKPLKICYIGDGNNVCTSLVDICRLLEVECVVVCPSGYEPLDSDSCKIEHNPELGIAGADVVYTDVWVSMGQETEREKRQKVFANYKVTAERMRKAAPGAVFMHCLPAKRGEEVEASVADGPQSVIFDQAENRLHAQKALLATLLGRK